MTTGEIVKAPAHQAMMEMPSSAVELREYLQQAKGALQRARNAQEKLDVKDYAEKIKVFAMVGGFASIQTEATIIIRQAERDIALAHTATQGGDRRSEDFQSATAGPLKSPVPDRTLRRWKAIYSPLAEGEFEQICLNAELHEMPLTHAAIAQWLEETRGETSLDVEEQTADEQPADEEPKEKKPRKKAVKKEEPVKEHETEDPPEQLPDDPNLEQENAELKAEVSDLRSELRMWEKDAGRDETERIHQLHTLNTLNDAQKSQIFNLHSVINDLKAKLKRANAFIEKQKATIAKLDKGGDSC